MNMIVKFLGNNKKKRNKQKKKTHAHVIFTVNFEVIHSQAQCMRVIF